MNKVYVLLVSSLQCSNGLAHDHYVFQGVFSSRRKAENFAKDNGWNSIYISHDKVDDPDWEPVREP